MAGAPVSKTDAQTAPETKENPPRIQGGRRGLLLYALGFTSFPLSRPRYRNRGIHRKSGVGGFAGDTSPPGLRTLFTSRGSQVIFTVTPEATLAQPRTVIRPIQGLAIPFHIAPTPFLAHPLFLCSLVRHTHLLIFIAPLGPIRVFRDQGILANRPAASSEKSSHICRRDGGLQVLLVVG